MSSVRPTHDAKLGNSSSPGPRSIQPGRSIRVRDSWYTERQRSTGGPEKKNWLVREKKLSRYVPDSNKRLQTRIAG